MAGRFTPVEERAYKEALQLAVKVGKRDAAQAQGRLGLWQALRTRGPERQMYRELETVMGQKFLKGLRGNKLVIDAMRDDIEWCGANWSWVGPHAIITLRRELAEMSLMAEQRT
ncbi:MAG TPA: hypothetical protein VGO34_11305 [Alphaproteobacteria bacterium]|jgi:hypothetical protein